MIRKIKLPNVSRPVKLHPKGKSRVVKIKIKVKR